MHNKELKIPEAAINRISVYSRYLTELENSDMTHISSVELAEGTGGNSAQVRKDLAYFGEFGVRGVGYNIRTLNHEIKRILGLERPWNVILVGAGNMGKALSQYVGFKDRGFNMLAAFDNDIDKVGLMLNGVPVYAINQLEDFIEKNDVDIAMITVPADYAQDVADVLADTRIKGILNFAPVMLNVANGIEVRNVDLAVNLEILTYNIEAKK